MTLSVQGLGDEYQRNVERNVEDAINLLPKLATVRALFGTPFLRRYTCVSLPCLLRYINENASSFAGITTETIFLFLGDVGLLLSLYRRLPNLSATSTCC
jgi:hypothetical protein